jgi:ribonuclease J
MGVAGLEEGRAGLAAEALAAVEALSPAARVSPGEVQEALRTAVRRWFRRTTGRRPSVLAVVLEL